MIRKYITEFGLNMVGGPSALVQQADLNREAVQDAFGDANPCHIYMVCRRPRITIRPDEVGFTDRAFEGYVTIQDGLTLIREPFSVGWGAGADSTFSSEYPFNECTILGPDGRAIVRGNAAALARYLGWSVTTHLDAEVLYVGQAYGENGNRIAPDRLRKHSTLQSIYAEAISRTPDKEIWLALWSFEETLITCFDGTPQSYGTSTTDDDAHIDSVLNNTMSEQQKINFTEGALIRYFDPEYNVMFRKTFPSPAHSTYAECYDLDINSVMVELNTEEWGSMLWSKASPRKWIHFIQYALHNPLERKAMFDVL
jgi:hypothetical protein